MFDTVQQCQEPLAIDVYPQAADTINQKQKLTVAMGGLNCELHVIFVYVFYILTIYTYVTCILISACLTEIAAYTYIIVIVQYISLCSVAFYHTA